MAHEVMEAITHFNSTVRNASKYSLSCLIEILLLQLHNVRLFLHEVRVDGVLQIHLSSLNGGTPISALQ